MIAMRGGSTVRTGGARRWDDPGKGSSGSRSVQHEFSMFLVRARNGRQHAPTRLPSEQDHQRMMDRLNINRCGRGADGDPMSPNAANYDKPKANRYAKLPDTPLLNDV